jgi:hypothetical protein
VKANGGAGPSALLPPGRYSVSGGAIETPGAPEDAKVQMDRQRKEKTEEHLILLLLGMIHIQTMLP